MSAILTRTAPFISLFRRKRLPNRHGHLKDHSYSPFKALPHIIQYCTSVVDTASSNLTKRITERTVQQDLTKLHHVLVGGGRSGTYEEIVIMTHFSNLTWLLTPKFSSANTAVCIHRYVPQQYTVKIQFSRVWIFRLHKQKDRQKATLNRLWTGIPTKTLHSFAEKRAKTSSQLGTYENHCTPHGACGYCPPPSTSEVKN
jgi:hypothetical protein